MAYITNSAPAGAFYRNIFHAGHQNLNLHARQFPYQPNSAILPPIYTSKYTERIDPATNKPVPRPDLVNPTTAQQHEEWKHYEGLVGTHSGSEAEWLMFQQLDAMVQKQSSDAILVLHSFAMNEPKMQALSIDVPTTLQKLQHFRNHGTKFEADFLILVRNVGIIVVEVKVLLKCLFTYQFYCLI